MTMNTDPEFPITPPMLPNKPMLVTRCHTLLQRRKHVERRLTTNTCVMAINGIEKKKHRAHRFVIVVSFSFIIAFIF
jgi:uncharacterized membrane protein YozB (DUF420 family)